MSSIDKNVDDLMDVVDTYDQMDPLVLKARLSQIQNLGQAAYSFFASVNERASAALADNRESVEECHARCNMMMEWLTSMSGHEMSFEEMKFVVENMKWTVEKDQEINNENQAFQKEILNTVCKYVGIGAFVLLLTVGIRHFTK